MHFRTTITYHFKYFNNIIIFHFRSNGPEINSINIENDFIDTPVIKSSLKNLRKCRHCHNLISYGQLKKHENNCVIYSQFITKSNKCMWAGCGRTFSNRTSANLHFGKLHSNHVTTNLTKNNPTKNNNKHEENIIFEFDEPPIEKNNKVDSKSDKNEQNIEHIVVKPDFGDVPQEMSPDVFMSSENLVVQKSKVSANSNPKQNDVQPILQGFPENTTVIINSFDFESIPRMEKLNLIQKSLNGLRNYIQKYQGDVNMYEFINTEINFNKSQIETMIKNITVVSADREEIKLLKIQVDEILGNWRRKCFKKTGRFPTSPPPAPPEASTSAPCASSASRRVKSSESVKIHPIKNLDGISLLSQMNSNLYICPFEDCSNR